MAGAALLVAVGSVGRSWAGACGAGMGPCNEGRALGAGSGPCSEGVSGPGLPKAPGGGPRARG